MSEGDGTPEELQLHVLGQRMDPHRLVYGTIILMTAFAIYDTTADAVQLGARPFITLVGVVVAPLFALTMAHAFSEALDMQIRRKRSLTPADRRHLVASNLQYLYLAIPPLALVLAMSLVHVHPATIVASVQTLGMISLFGWGIFAGVKAELSRPRALLMGVNYMLSGIVVIALELFLTH